MNPRHLTLIVALLPLALALGANAQAPKSDAPEATATSIDALTWLEGCWRGSANQREFREHWLPLRGGMMVGVGHLVMQDKTLDYEFLRVESRPDGVYYVAMPRGKPETPLKLTSAVTEERGTTFTFTNPADQWPQRIIYHRGSEGWLYATIEGTLNGEERKVTYPMRRVGCESGELIRK